MTSDAASEKVNMAMTLGDAAAMALAFVLFVIVVSVGGSVLAGIQSSQTAGSVAANATGAGLTGITNLAAQSGTIGTVIGAAVLIGIVLSAFYFGKQQ
jgi:hypothetical protein